MDLQDGKRMFGDIKSKLGFGSKNQDQGYDDSYYDDGYDDYADDYDDYGDYADDYQDDAGSGYNHYAPVTTRAAGSRRASSDDAGMPRLVSIDDVRANTQIPSSLNRDPLPPRRVTSASGSSFGRTMVDSSLPPQMTPEGTAATAAAASRRRSEGLDSLFEPTTGEGAEPASNGAHRHARTGSGAAGSAAGAAASAGAGGVSAGMGAHAAASASAGAYDPYESYAGNSTGSYTGRRTLTVLTPVSYGEVEQVAKALKAGDVVVLALHGTPDALSKRLLDFSFGAAAVLDASVECIADKVFAIARGNGISEVERMNLRNQGVLQ